MAVAYAKHDVSYTVSCVAGREVLKVSFVPKLVTAGGKMLAPHKAGGDGYTYDAATGLLVVRHSLSGVVRAQG